MFQIYKKLENSLCVISFSKEYVASYHLALARSLTEYMYQGKHGELSHVKKVTITKPDNLNSVPPSKVCIRKLVSNINVHTICSTELNKIKVESMIKNERSETTFQ